MSRVDYQAVGSGAGTTMLLEKHLTFAGSDLAMNQRELAETAIPVVQIPMTAGAMVLVYQLEGVDKLRLSREELSLGFSRNGDALERPLIVAIIRALTCLKRRSPLVTRAIRAARPLS